MADRHPEVGTAEEMEKLARPNAEDDDLSRLRTPDELEIADENHDEESFVPPEQEQKAEPAKSSPMAAVVWMAINTLATVGIVCGIP